MTDDRRWLDDHVDLYALDCLPVAEELEVQTRLDRVGARERADYEDRIAQTRAVMAEYAKRYAREAPAPLRTRVLDDFRQGTTTSPRGAESAGVVTPLRRRRRVAVLAACAAIAVAATAGVAVGRFVVPSRPAGITAEAEAAAAVFAAPDARITVGAFDGRDGVLTVASSRSLDRAVVAVGDLGGPLPDQRVLQLWMVDAAGQPASAGLFDARTAPIVVDSLVADAVFAVTLEPRGGSRAPTTPVLARVSV